MSLRTGNSQIRNWAIIICALLATSALILAFKGFRGTKLHFEPRVERQSFVESKTFDELREKCSLTIDVSYEQHEGISTEFSKQRAVIVTICRSQATFSELNSAVRQIDGIVEAYRDIEESSQQVVYRLEFDNDFTYLYVTDFSPQDPPSSTVSPGGAESSVRLSISQQ